MQLVNLTWEVACGVHWVVAFLAIALFPLRLRPRGFFIWHYGRVSVQEAGLSKREKSGPPVYAR